MKPKLVFVEWEDSYGCSPRWQDINPDGNPTELLCHSVGWVIYKNKRCIVVVPHITAQEVEGRKQGCGDMTIPTAAIRRLVPLVLPKQKQSH